MNTRFFLFLCSALLNSQSFAQVPRTIDSSGIEITGLSIPQSILNRPLSDPCRRDYILAQRIRTRNRTMLDLALNYAPISFISGWYFDPFRSDEKPTPYILHADVSPQFAIGGEWNRFPVLLTARFKVRIFGEDSSHNDVSLPVRTPSFMPGGTVFIPFQNLLTEESDKVSFGSLSVFHHSNGQDGAEFSAPGVFNKYNGNFSNNYVEPALWYRFRIGGGTPAVPVCPGSKYPYSDVFFRLGYEINFSTAVRLKSTYGTGHINFNTGYVRVHNYCDSHGCTGELFEQPYYAELYRILFNASLVTGNRDLELGRFEKRINFEGSFHYRLPSSPNTAAFISAGYYGSDPYNIYYEDSYWYVRAGISAGLFIAPRHRHLCPESPATDSE